MKDQSLDKYQKAYEEWDNRLGSAKTQLNNWRVACIISLIFSVLLAVAVIIQLSTNNRFVYVAQVSTGDKVMNVREATAIYKPTEAQKGAFLANFINNIMSIPLDPVVLRSNWTKGYQFVSSKALIQLNKFALSYGAFSDVGVYTKIVKVEKISPMGNNSYDLTWLVTTTNKYGKTTDVSMYNGVFTFVSGRSPKTLQEMLVNPMGLKIGYFSFNKKGSSQ